MSLVEQFAVSNAATKSLALSPSDPADLGGWERPGHKLEMVYMIEDGFGIVGMPAGIVGSMSTSVGGSELERRTTVDATGRIGQFFASNLSAVLAQPSGALSMPRPVFLKRSELRDVIRDTLTYIMSDPFQSLYQALDRLGGSEALAKSAAVQNAKRVLDAARKEGTLPSRILRGTSGVFVYFSSGSKYAEIECDDDGDIGVVTSDRSGHPTVWFGDSHQLGPDLAKIRAFLV